MTVPNNSVTAVGFIPTRGGSKGVTQKNMRPIAGRPLLYYTLEAAKASSCISHLVVSTDDDQIEEFASSNNVDVMRHPAHLSIDGASTYPVVQWGLAELARSGKVFDFCIVMRATTPLRSAKDIDESFALLLSRPDADSLVSVKQVVGVHPARLKGISSAGFLTEPFLKEGYYPQPRQTFEQLYVRNGGIYIAQSSIMETRGLWGENCIAYVMPEERSININTEFEMKTAEILLQESETKSKR